jgi:DNA polymerase-1
MTARTPARHVLIDGNNLLYRTYYVFVTLREKNGEPPLTSAAGYPTGLIYGAMSLIADWIGAISRPTKVVLFLDGVPSRRLSMDPDYKKKDEDSTIRLRGNDLPLRLLDGYEARHDVDILSYVLRLFGVDVYYGADEEADDLIASYVHARPDDMHVIVSSDRDFYQILADHVVMYRPGVEGSRFFDVERATEDMKKLAGVPLPPSHIRMFKSFTGDTSDNIPGVPRLRKKVVASFCHHPDPASVYSAGLPGMSKNEHEKTVSMRDRVELNYRLVGMESNIDLTPFLQPALNDFATGLRILKEDLQIVGVDTNAFRLQEVGRTIVAPALPDWLIDI